MSEPAAEAGPGGGALDASAAKLREAAKWLVASFAAVGAVLVSGLQISEIGDLTDDTRRWVALAAILLGVAAVVAAVSLVVDVLIPSDLAFEELVRREIEHGDADEIVKFVHENPQLLEGAAVDLAGLRDAYTRALEARWDKTDAYFDAPDDDKKLSAQIAHNRAATINRIIGTVLDVATWERLRGKFARRRPWVAVLAFVIAGSVAAFAWAANPPAKAKPATADLRGADLTGADLSGASLRGADLRGMTLRDTDLTQTNLEDAKLDDVTWHNVTCPDGTDSDNAGRTCKGHIAFKPGPLPPR